MKQEVAAACALGSACAFLAPTVAPVVPEARGLPAKAAAGAAGAAGAPVALGAAALASVAAACARRTQRRARGGFETLKSEEIFTEAKDLMPGGVSSPVRAFKSVGGNPVVFDKVKGAYAWDVDGNQYVDYVGTWGPAIIGHADDKVLEALTKQMQTLRCTALARI